MKGPIKSHICSLSDFSWDLFPGKDISPTKSHFWSHQKSCHRDVSPKFRISIIFKVSVTIDSVERPRNSGSPTFIHFG